MKSTSGKITSTKEISLARTSKVLAKFVSADTGASQAVSSYLRRASGSFDELVQRHKELKSSNLDLNPRKLEQANSSPLFNGELTVKKEENEGSEGKRHKKRRMRKREEISSKKEEKRRRIKEED